MIHVDADERNTGRQRPWHMDGAVLSALIKIDDSLSIVDHLGKSITFPS